MSCCGKKRAAAAAIARPQLDRPSIPPAAAKVSAPPVGNDPRVRYLGPGNYRFVAQFPVACTTLPRPAAQRAWIQTTSLRYCVLNFSCAIPVS